MCIAERDVAPELTSLHITAVQIRPAQMIPEAIAAAVMAVYIASALIGKRMNKEAALGWWREHVGLLNEVRDKSPLVLLTYTDSRP